MLGATPSDKSSKIAFTHNNNQQIHHLYSSSDDGRTDTQTIDDVSESDEEEKEVITELNKITTHKLSDTDQNFQNLELPKILSQDQLSEETIRNISSA